MLTHRRLARLRSLTFVGQWSLAGAGGDVLPALPSIRAVTLQAPQLPEPWDGLRIAQISDVHSGPYMPRQRMEQVRDLVAHQDPDIIVFTGDQLDRRPSDAVAFTAGFAGLSAPLGVYGILGNHDHMVGKELATSALTEAGIRPLVNETAVLEREGCQLALVGVDDLLARGTPGADFSLLGNHPGAFRICLCHQPRGWLRAVAAGAHLTLAGHTHGGQIALTRRNLNPARVHTRYIAGPYRRDDAFLYVSRGIGVGAVPLRFGAPPEIDLVTLRRSGRVAQVAA